MTYSGQWQAETGGKSAANRSSFPPDRAETSALLATPRLLFCLVMLSWPQRLALPYGYIHQLPLAPHLRPLQGEAPQIRCVPAWLERRYTTAWPASAPTSRGIQGDRLKRAHAVGMLVRPREAGTKPASLGREQST